VGIARIGESTLRSWLATPGSWLWPGVVVGAGVDWVVATRVAPGSVAAGVVGSAGAADVVTEAGFAPSPTLGATFAGVVAAAGACATGAGVLAVASVPFAAAWAAPVVVGVAVALALVALSDAGAAVVACAAVPAPEPFPDPVPEPSDWAVPLLFGALGAVELDDAEGVARDVDDEASVVAALAFVALPSPGAEVLVVAAAAWRLSLRGAAVEAAPVADALAPAAASNDAVPAVLAAPDTAVVLAASSGVVAAVAVERSAAASAPTAVTEAVVVADAAAGAVPCAGASCAAPASSAAAPGSAGAGVVGTAGAAGVAALFVEEVFAGFVGLAALPSFGCAALPLGVARSDGDAPAVVEARTSVKLPPVAAASAGWVGAAAALDGAASGPDTVMDASPFIACSTGLS
jgi:hypothetical protein